MVISNQYGQIATPSENNSAYVTVAASCNTPFQIPANLPTESIPIAINAFTVVTGAAPDNSPGGTFGSFATLQNNLPL